MEYCVCFFTFGISLVFKRMVWDLLVVLSYVMWRVWHLRCCWKTNKQAYEQLSFISFHLCFPNIYSSSLYIPHSNTIKRKVGNRKKKRLKECRRKKCGGVGGGGVVSIWGIKISKISQKNQATQVEGRMNRKFCSVLSVLDDICFSISNANCLKEDYK